MILTNASSKTITLLNGKKIKPKETINIDISKSSEIYEQVMSLNKSGLIDID
jgi:uncharacterized protein YlzI (FlbEa/FlbD family)